MDWDLGRYEHIAAQLHPVATIVVEAVAPRAGEHVLDLGCGTGNAAFLVEKCGARVTGVDPSPRLLEVARTEASARGVDVEFLLGDAAAIPVPDASLDAVVSVFGVIFAPDASAAASEMARVLAARGRLAISAWIPEGAMADQARLRREAVAAALGTPPGAPPFAWHDEDAVTALLGPYGLMVEFESRSLAFTATSARDYAEEECRHHPLWVEARAVLEPLGGWRALCEDVRDIYTEANEDPSAFRVTSRYVVVTATRTGRT